MMRIAISYQRSAISQAHGPGASAGATLLEVLMAMVVMSIGVLTVATLFPISVLRAVQATKLTNATIMRFNAEALIHIDKNLVLDPDRDNNLVEHVGTNYLVDPLGYHVHATQADGAQASFGGLGKLMRYNFGTTDEQTAEDLVADPDSWNSQIEAIVDTTLTTSTSVTVAPNSGLNSVNHTSLISRVILIDATGKRSEARIINRVPGYGINSQTIRWDEDANANGSIDQDEDSNGNGVLETHALPAGFVPVMARVETHEPRNFSWMLNVRNDGVSGVFVDVVVFFRRPFGLNDERVYTFAANELIPVGNGTQYDVVYRANDPKYWKRGGFLFDVDASRWYRIQKVQDGAGRATITLEKPPPATIRSASFMRNVVDVYALGDIR